MSKLVILILFIIAGLAYLLFKPASKTDSRRKNKSTQRIDHDTASTASGAAKSYHGVSIEMGANHCPAVEEFSDKRFLSNEAPMIPLSDCTLASCECRYVHYQDRRDEEDRRALHSIRTDLHDRTGQVERRGNGERRKSD